MSGRVIAVVMAGGRGERFWPLSTPERPKQFLDLTGGGTLIQQTVERLLQIVPYREILVVTSAAHVDLARAQLPQVPPQNFLVEPVGRDTAPCVGLAAVWIERLDPDAAMLVLPADHYIPDRDRFCERVLDVVEGARRTGGLVTLGIQPDRPETGYGYIEVGEACPEAGGGIHRVRRFVEKPDADQAAAFVASGGFLWNAGIFACTVSAIRSEIAHHLPDLHVGLEALARSDNLETMSLRLPEVFPRLPKISIDYGVLERSDRVFVVPCDFRWDDLGSWTAVARLRQPDGYGNVVSGAVLVEDCRNLVVEARGGRQVAVLGVRDLVVVETPDAVLICAADRVQEVRKLAVRAQGQPPQCHAQA